MKPKAGFGGGRMLVGPTEPVSRRSAAMDPRQKKTTFIPVRYYATYHYAAVVQDMLSDRFAYLQEIHDFLVDDEHLPLAEPYRRSSAFHSFIRYVVHCTMHTEFHDDDLEERQHLYQKYHRIPGAIDDMRPAELAVDQAFLAYGIPYPTFVQWLKDQGKTFLKADDNDLDEFCQEVFLTADYESLLGRIVGEVFFLLFQNRHLLLLFNEIVAEKIAETRLQALPPEFLPYFTADGVLKRVRIPAWARRAVKYRDRGRCTNCRSDISGLLAVSNVEHFDHIVPLDKGGLNDVSNLQLLCEKCNLRKGRKRRATSIEYENWYAMGNE